MSDTADRIAIIAAAIVRDCATLQRLASVVPEPPPRELAPLIVQLADVERETRDHFVRYPHDRARMAGSPYSCESEAREWQILCRRKAEVVDALVRYAVAATAAPLPMPSAANQVQP